MIIAIDGPSGSGKGTLALSLSKSLNLQYLDTGLLYRAVAYRFLHRNAKCPDHQSLEYIARDLSYSDFSDPTQLRSEEVAQIASQVAEDPLVRKALYDFQRSFVREYPKDRAGVVLDGRDIGTNICPDADFKFFLIASIETRARRRYEELQKRGIQSIYKQVLEDMRQRDERDASRLADPALPAQDAIIIDTTDMDADAVFHFVSQKISKAPK